MALRYYFKQLLLIGVLVWGAYSLMTPYAEYAKTRDALRDLDRALLAQQEENERLRREIHKLRTDPQAIERVAREKFGYCRAPETVYDFADPGGRPAGGPN